MTSCLQLLRTKDVISGSVLLPESLQVERMSTVPIEAESSEDHHSLSFNPLIRRREPMRRVFISASIVLLLTSCSAFAQVGMPGIEYSTSIAAGDGGQLYPYDQQDPWLHGHYQRVPAYGGFASFRPYNYRHVFSQTQIATGWGASHGMPYSQQFWNRYRGSYLQGNLHSAAVPTHPVLPSEAHPAETRPIYQTGFAASQQQHGPSPVQQRIMTPQTSADGRAIHVFPSQVNAQ